MKRLRIYITEQIKNGVKCEGVRILAFDLEETLYKVYLHNKFGLNKITLVGELIEEMEN